MATLERRRAVTISSEVCVGGCRATVSYSPLSKHPARPGWVFVLHRKIQSSFPRALLPYLARARANGRTGGGIGTDWQFRFWGREVTRHNNAVEHSLEPSLVMPS